MKYLSFFSLFFFICFSVSAQTKQEKVVAVAVEKIRMAMISGDKASLESIVSENLSYGHSSGVVESKSGFVENIARGKSDFVTIDLSDQTISVNDKVAVVRHTLNGTTNDNGKQAAVKLKVLLVWHNEKGGWKLLARQAVKIV